MPASMPHSLDRLETLYGKCSEAIAEAQRGDDFLGYGMLWILTRTVRDGRVVSPSSSRTQGLSILDALLWLLG